MATDWAVANAVMVKNEEWVAKAQSLIPELRSRVEIPEKVFMMHGTELVPCNHFTEECFKKGDKIVFDFGGNKVGYFSINCLRKGSPQDAPAFLKLRFCEVEKELYANTAVYDGWISRGWIQEEWVHLDKLPHRLDMPRRYTFRYVCIEVLDTSQKFQIAFTNAVRKTVSAVDENCISGIETDDLEVKRIDKAAVRTLANCMQRVFEDGPKRDRRLWLGDLWLQAKVNYETFKDYDLVKRCLYLFAGMPNQEGQIAACVFTDDEPLMDDTFLLDYSLLFIPTLLDYYEATHDRETFVELSDSAFKQIEVAMKYLDDRYIVQPEAEYHCFIDWNDKLDKQCAMQAVMLYALKQAIRMCEYLEINASEYEMLYTKMKDAALCYLYDDKKHVFVSGDEEQISVASQIWMILAEVLDREQGKKTLKQVDNHPVSMVTPFLHHVYLEALLLCGEKEHAIQHIKEYWGGMIRLDADTFWELFDPENLEWSPYGSDIINSYCHAWSCTPAYIFRKYDL